MQQITLLNTHSASAVISIGFAAKRDYVLGKEAHFNFFLEAEKSLKTLIVHSPRVLGLPSIGIELSIKMDTSSTPSGSLRISFLVFFTP